MQLRLTFFDLEEICSLDRKMRQEPITSSALNAEAGLTRFLKSLNISERRELAALVFLGKGHYASFSNAYSSAARHDSDGDGFAVYLTRKQLSVTIPRGICRAKQEGVSPSRYYA